MRRLLSLLGSVAMMACSTAPADDGGGDPGGGGGGGGEDLGGGPDAGGGPTVMGDPIVVPPDQYDQWVWVPIPGMVCGDGSPSGVGVR